MSDEYDIEKAVLLKNLGWQPAPGDRVLAEISVGYSGDLSHAGGQVHVGTILRKVEKTGQTPVFGDWHVRSDRGIVQRFANREIYPCVLREKTS